MPLLHLASRLYGTPLLIARTKLDVILGVLGPRVGLAPVPPAAALLPVPEREAPEPRFAGGIAVIPIHGTLVRRTLGLEVASGLTSYAEIAAQLDAAAADPRVQGILLDIDSPGGEAGGVFELARRIRALNAEKPVWAHANDAAFSAAYALAAGASRITLSETAGVGSIGVIALHVDQSMQDAKAGLAYTAIYAGAHKNDYSPHAPLTPTAQSALQIEVDRLYAIFIEHVATLRAVAPDGLRALEAALLFGEAAVEAGLADAVASFETVTAEFTTALAARQTLRSGSAARRVPPARASPVDEPIVFDVSPSLPSVLEPTMPTPEAVALPEPSLTSPDPALAVVEPNAAAATVVASPQATFTDPVTTMPSRAEAQAIAELCLLAGRPEDTARYLAAGLSDAQVRHELLIARAEQPEIRSQIAIDARTDTSPEAGPVVAAVKKLFTRG